jgi:hypothetical protein
MMPGGLARSAIDPARATWILAAAGVLGLAADRLLWMGPLGPGLAVWVGLLGIVAMVLVHRRTRRWNGAVGAWSLVAVAAAAGTAWRAAPELGLLFFLVLIVAAAGVVLEARRRHFGRLRVLDEAHGLALVPALAATGAVPLLVRAELPWAPQRRRTLAVGRGLLLAAPPVVVFGALLAAADPTFERYATKLTTLGMENLPAHLVMTLGFGWIAAGLLRGALPGPRGNPLDRLRPQRVGVEETAVILGLVTALFAAFVLLQATYLFGGRAALESISGLTLAEYARRGFFELVAASGLVLALLLVVGAAAPRGSGRWVYRALAGLLIGLVLLVIASALLRLRLYVEAFGLTTDRFYAAALVVWIGLALGWFAVTVVRGRPRMFASGAVAMGIAAVFVLGALDPAALVARTNLDRESPRPVDGPYLRSLGADAVPAVVAGLAALDPDDQCAAARHLLDRWGPENPARGAHQSDWRVWNAGEAAARSAVADHASRLAELSARCATSSTS